MKVWVVTKILDYTDGDQNRHFEGCYSSYENAVEAIKNYDYEKLKGELDVKYVRELTSFNGSLAYSRRFCVNEGFVDTILLKVSKIPIIVDEPI